MSSELMSDGDVSPVDAAAAPRRGREPVRYSLPVVRAFLARVASGESQASIHRDPTMPGRGGVAHWVKKRPRFAERLRRARIESGHTGPGGSASTYCPAAAQEIYRRLCEGESLSAICRDAALPCFSTVYQWRKRFPEFADIMRLAREVQAERFCDLGWEIAEAATPRTTHLTNMQLKQLRWMVGYLSPRNFGRVKAIEPELPPAEPTQMLWRHFRVEEREDGWVRVVAFNPNPHTGLVERDPEENPWSPPPSGRWRLKQRWDDGVPASVDDA